MDDPTLPPELVEAITVHGNENFWCGDSQTDDTRMYEQYSKSAKAARERLVAAIEKYGQSRYDDGRHDEYRRHVRVPQGMEA